MNPEAHKIIAQLNSLYKEGGAEVVTKPIQQAALTGRLMILLAEEQQKSAEVMKRQTTWLIFLTWAVVILTGAVLFYTVEAYKGANAQAQRDSLQQHSKPKNP